MALTGAAGEKSAADGAHAAQQIAPGAGAVAPCLPLPQAKPPGAVAPQEGDIRPPFFGSRGRQGLRPLQPRKVLGFGLACRLGRPLGNVPPGRSGPLKRWTKLLLVSTQLAWRDPPLRNARRRLVLSGHGPRARAFGPASLRKPRRPKAAVSAAASVGPERSPPGTRTATCPVRSRTA